MLGNFSDSFILELFVFALDWSVKVSLVGTHRMCQLFFIFPSALVFFTNPSIKDTNKFTLNKA